MKKLFLITLLVCCIGTFTACGKEEPQTTGTSETVQDNAHVKETQESSDKETLQEGISEKGKEETKEDANKEATDESKDNTKEDTEIKNNEAVESPEILSLKQTYSTRYEWQDAIWLLYSEYSNVTMWEGAEQYSEIERVLSEKAGMQTRSMEDESDNILSFITDMGMLDGDLADFETQVSTSNVQVRRADNVVLSLVTDSYADYGFIEDFRAMWGSSYDVQTGKELLLSDVILDMDVIPGIVCKELNSHLWAGEDYPEAVVEEYFENTPEDGICWSLDYNGVTFYFGYDDFTEMSSVGKTATISFAEYPELFVEKYRNVPEAYMVRLPLDYSFFTDLDSDGNLEELNCTGLFNETDRFYTQFGIYTDVNGCYQYEELFAYDFQPYYVKTEDGNHYIYLFCEENEIGNHVQGQMMLVVYNVNGGVVTRVGDMNIGPAYIPSDMFLLPLDPNHMLLDNYDSGAQDFEVYKVGKGGMPTLNTQGQTSSKEEDLTSEVVEVDSVEEFLEAIQPGATIKIQPGYYNLSEYIEKTWSEQGEEWNQKHPYVDLYECWDGGIEVAIQDVQDLSVFADLEGAVVTELVVETRAGAVLNFEDCSNIFLHGLTMGHTQDGACDSSVISFRNTTNVYLTAMDLYGCGMYGFDAMYGSGNIYVQSCTIRDCEDGPFYIMDAQGKYEFRNCWLKGSNGGGYYEPADGAELSFIECNFGEKETNYWYFDEYATFTDCYWEEVTEYPDVEPEGEDVVDIDSLIPVDANEWNLGGTYYAYMFVDQQSGETEYYPYFTLELHEDRGGWCETEDEYFELTWFYESDGTVTLEVKLEGDLKIYRYLSVYKEPMDGYDKLWIMMQLDEKVVWLY